MSGQAITLVRSWLSEPSNWKPKNYRRVILAVVIAFAIYTVSLWAVASSTLDVISSFHLSDIASDEATIDETVDLAIDILDSVADSAARTRRVATPALALCGVGRLVPPVRDNCDAVNGLFDRFEHDKSSAISLLNAVRSMDRLVVSLRSDEVDSVVIDLATSIDSLRLDVSDFSESMAAAISIRRPEGAFVLPQIAVGYSRAASVEDDLQELAEFVRAGIRVLESGMTLKEVGGIAFEDLAVIGGSSTAFDDITSAFARIDPVAHQFRRDVEVFVNLMPAYLENSGIHETIDSISDDAELIADLILGIGIPIKILDDSFSKIRSSDSPLLASGGMSMILKNLITHEPELHEASQNLQRAQKKMTGGSDLRRLFGAEVANRLESVLNQYSGLIETLSDAPAALKSLLGDSGAKKYLVLGQSSDELRPAGGFTSSVWVMTLYDGALVDIEYVDVLTFGERRVLGQIPDVPDELRIHMDAGAWYLRDVGWSPDFRSVAETAVLMNAATGHAPVDGVISLTQWGFVYLVDGLGSIDTPAGELSGSEVMAAIEQGTDSEGTGYLLTLFDSMIDSLTVDKFKGNFVSFARSFLRSFDEKQIMIYAVDDELESQIVDLGWSGALTPPTGDILGVFDSNVGWNKVGRNIARSVEYQIELTPGGGGTSKLSVTYENNSRSDSSACDEQSEPPPGGNVYNILKDGCYWNYQRVYTPLGAKVESLPKLPAPDSSVAVRTGRMRSGSDTAGVFFDEVGQYFGGLLVVPPNTVTTVEFEYEIPEGTANASGDELEYVLNVPIQAGLPRSDLRVRIVFPDGYRIIESDHDSDSSDSRIFHINHVLDSDFELRVVAKRTG